MYLYDTFNYTTFSQKQKIKIPKGVLFLTRHLFSCLDYYPFGMQMPGRHGNTGDYRYGFQGQETDDEITGSESHVAFRYRIQDVRLGRFLSVDPLGPKFPWFSPYHFAGNSPIAAIDLEGLENVWVEEINTDNGTTVTLKIKYDASGNPTGPKNSIVLLNMKGGEPISEGEKGRQYNGPNQQAIENRAKSLMATYKTKEEAAKSAQGHVSELSTFFKIKKPTGPNNPSDPLEPIFLNPFDGFQFTETPAPTATPEVCYHCTNRAADVYWDQANGAGAKDLNDIHLDETAEKFANWLIENPDYNLEVRLGLPVAWGGDDWDGYSYSSFDYIPYGAEGVALSTFMQIGTKLLKSHVQKILDSKGSTINATERMQIILDENAPKSEVQLTPVPR